MMGNVGIGASCYPRPLQTKRDASQVASIHLSGKGARPFQETFASFSVMAAKQSNSLNQRQNNNRRISLGISHSQLGFVRSVDVLPQVFTYLGAELYSTPFRSTRVIFAVNKLLQGDMMPTCFMFQIFNVSLPR